MDGWMDGGGWTKWFCSVLLLCGVELCVLSVVKRACECVYWPYYKENENENEWIFQLGNDDLSVCLYTSIDRIQKAKGIEMKFYVTSQISHESAIDRRRIHEPSSHIYISDVATFFVV